jgi:hypothetical protein
LVVAKVGLAAGGEEFVVAQSWWEVLQVLTLALMLGTEVS